MLKLVPRHDLPAWGHLPWYKGAWRVRRYGARRVNHIVDPLCAPAHTVLLGARKPLDLDLAHGPKAVAI
jgi:hypothetical protein